MNNISNYNFADYDNTGAFDKIMQVSIVILGVYILSGGIIANG